MSIRRVGAALVLSALLACGGGKPKPPGGGPLVEATTTAATVSIRVTGAAEITFSGQTQLQIVVTDAPSLAQNLRFTSVAIPAPIKASGRDFQMGFNLVGTTGEGRFEIAAPPASPGPGIIPSAVYLRIVAPAKVNFDRPSTPCIVELRNHSRSGSLTCEGLQGDGGKRVGLSMTWSA